MSESSRRSELISKGQESSRALLEKQRSHVLLILSNPEAGSEAKFPEWYCGPYRHAVANTPGMLRMAQYARHEVDITQGLWPPPPFQYLSICELSLDGAQAAQSLIEWIAQLHHDHPAAQAPATWLYYPASEKVGQLATATQSMLIVAFANGLAGQEAEFREWYATRHIRHALLIPTLVSGQYFERTQFQQPGAAEASYGGMALYECGPSTAESYFEGQAAVPKGALRFPSLDVTSPRFGEALYRPL